MSVDRMDSFGSLFDECLQQLGLKILTEQGMTLIVHGTEEDSSDDSEPALASSSGSPSESSLDSIISLTMDEALSMLDETIDCGEPASSSGLGGIPAVDEDGQPGMITMLLPGDVWSMIEGYGLVPYEAEAEVRDQTPWREVFVRGARDGRRIAVTYDEATTVAQVKASIEEDTGIPSSFMFLSFAGHLLDDSRTMGSYSIDQHADIHLAVRGPGGGKRARAGADAVVSGGGGRMDRDQKLSAMHEALVSVTMTARAPMFSTQDTEDVIARMHQAEQYMTQQGGKNAFRQMLMGVSGDNLKDMMSQLDTSNVESRFSAIAKTIGRSLINRAETRQKGHQKIITIVKDTIAYIASHAFIDRKGTFSWEECTQMIMTVIEDMARNGGRAAAAAPVNNAFADVDMLG
jgi:hypothetical protein